MKTSELLNEIAPALAKAQSEIKNANFDTENPFFKSRYASLAAIRDAVTPSLSKNGIAVVQTTSEGEAKLIVHTRLIHTSGQWIESEFPIINDTNKPQAIGSAYSYAKRYSLAAICCIASEQDDDGNEANDHGKKAPEVRNMTGTPKASKAANRQTYTDIINEMNKAQSLEALKEWLKLRRKDIEAMPEDWIIEFDEAYSNHRDGLEAKAA